ncbi:MAG: hypothetical protein K0Q95_1729 [Bacteroidota bacterium]|nr:hypothetical protein [Bacteroidota bacterium]
MVDHFQETQKVKCLTFFEFIKEHYISDDGDESDNHTDMKLPFKTYESSSFSLITTAQLYSTRILPLEQSHNEMFFPEEKLIESAYLASIWQPPRIF